MKLKTEKTMNALLLIHIRRK